MALSFLNGIFLIFYVYTLLSIILKINVIFRKLFSLVKTKWGTNFTYCKYKKFNISLPNSKHFIKSHKTSNQTSNQKSNQKSNQNVIMFDKFKYRSNFISDTNINFNTLRLDEPNVIFKEIFKFEDTNKVRINEHKLYMSSQNSIINSALEVGFMLKTYVEIKVDTCNYNYLYTLEKPQ